MFFPRKLAVVNLKRIAQISHTSSLGMGQSFMFFIFRTLIIILVGENMGFGKVGGRGWRNPGLHPLYETLSMRCNLVVEILEGWRNCFV